ncbi:MAG: DNA alkylation repair protein [Kosmotogaceae bacterium]
MVDKDHRELIGIIQRELESKADYQYLKSSTRFFKKEDLKEVSSMSHGNRTPVVRKIAADYYKKIKKFEKLKILNLCEYLLATNYSEERAIAFDWAFRLKNRLDKEEFWRFERWLMHYVHHWGSCDDLCTHAFGYLLYKHPELIGNTVSWRNSDNRWFRRASAVVLIYSTRRKNILKGVFETCDTLMTDEDDLVRKGYGWLLKETGNKFPDEIFDYVMRNRCKMPRVSLRYAIEKYPEEKRRKAMA